MSQPLVGDHAWAGEPRELVVVCLDLFNSMHGRAAKSALLRSEQFLRHNYLVYQCVQEWQDRAAGKQAGIDLVNFDGDAVLVTFDHNYGETALSFACEIAERVRVSGFQTTAGIDTGEVAIVTLASGDARVGIRYAVGYPVDRAVRLSWIAQPGQVLATAALTSAAGTSGEFELIPSREPAGVSLDKWPLEQVALCGDVLVHSVHRRDGDDLAARRRPGNTSRTIQYFHRLQLNALDFLREWPNQWEILLRTFHHSEGWKRAESLDQFVEALGNSRVIDDDRIPELEVFDGTPLADFIVWRDSMIARIQDLRQHYADAAATPQIEEIEFRRSMERAVGELVLFSRASLKKLGAMA